MKHPSIIRLTSCFVLLCLAALTVSAQTAQITGRVSDASGAVVPATRITVTNTGTGDCVQFGLRLGF